MFLIQTCFDLDPTKRNSFNHVFMYIPIGPSKKQLYKIIIGLLLLCYLIFLGMYNPKAEEFGWTWNAIQANGYDYNALSWETRYEILNNSYNYRYWTFNSSTYGSFQIYNHGDITIPDSVKYGYVNGIVIYGSSTMLGPQAIRLNNGNERTTICSFTNIDSSFLTLYHDGTVSNSHGEKYYQFSCYVRPGQVFNNIEIVSSANKSDNALIQAGMHLKLSIDYFYSDNSQAVNSIQSNTDDIKNNLNDSSIDSSSANDLTSNSAFQDNNGLDAIIKAPLNFIQSLTSSTCSSISLTIPFIDANVSLPCMSTIYNKALGQQLVNLIALVINGVVLYRYCLKILQIVKDAKNPNKDGLEVLDL